MATVRSGERGCATILTGVGVREIPASVGQRLLWMIQHYRSDLGALSCPVLCRIRGPLDRAALNAAISALVHRHEALRTTFSGRGPRLVQSIQDSTEITLDCRDLSGQRDPAAAADGEIADELTTPVDVAVSPVRAVLWRLGDGEHVFCLNMHHLVSDAWSCGVLFRELCALYGAGVRGAANGDGLPAVPWQYRHFVDYQQDLLSGDSLRRHREYWRRQLAGAHLLRLTPRSRPAPADGAGSPGTGRVGVARADLDTAAVAAVHRLARRDRTTPFAVLLSVFLGQLRRLTGQRDLTVASLFANRLRPESRGTVGFLANMVLLRTRIPVAGTFADLVRAAHATALGALTHQEMPYQMLPLPALETGGIRVDDLVFQVVPDPDYRASAGGAEFELVVPESIGSRFPIEFTLAPVGDTYRVVLFHASDRLDSASAQELVSGFVTLAGTATATPDIPLADLGI
jgi:Condensation domain